MALGENGRKLHADRVHAVREAAILAIKMKFDDSVCARVLINAMAMNRCHVSFGRFGIGFYAIHK